MIILGISPDTVSDQNKFAEKLAVPFDLLADADHAVAEQYGVWGEKHTFGHDYMGVKRTTFIIDEQGLIQQVYENVVTKGHSEEILQFLSREVG